MTNREAFEKFDKDHFGKKDTPINYDQWQEPILGTRYLDNFVQTRYEYWQACSQHYEARIKELEDKVKELNTLCNVAVSEIEHLDKISPNR